MKRGIQTPLIVLAFILLCSLWNARELSTRSRRLLAQLDAAEQQASECQWDAAADAMEDGYKDWRAQRTYLHIFSRHDASDGADALYRRCILFARAGDNVGFLTELQLLREQLETLMETEQLSVGNIL